MDKKEPTINKEHISRWATLFDLQMDAAMANVEVVDTNQLLSILESTSNIYRGISERSEQLIASIKTERLKNARASL